MELIYISQWGEAMSLTENPYFFLTNVDGMTAANTSISSIVIGGIDGDTINNIQAQPRPMVFDLRIKSGVNVEEAKRAILQVVKLKQRCTIRWTQNNRTVTISGVVDSVEMPRFNKAVTMQFSIHCDVPYWQDVENIVAEINEFKALQYFTDDPYDMLYFPDGGIAFSEYDTSRTRTFVNYGDVSVGMVIEIIAVGTVTNPIIYDQNGNFLGVGYGTSTQKVTMNEGDVMIINTNIGQKSVTMNGVSLLNKIKPLSTWIQSDAGENEFSINSDDSAVDNMIFTATYSQRYL